MVRGKLKNGFEYEIEDHTLNDMELLDLIHEVDEDRSMLPELIRKLLGKDQKKAFYDSLRTENGNVPVDETVLALREIFEQSSETKNSLPSPE